jgi:predicted metal-dependent hydrolase
LEDFICSDGTRLAVTLRTSTKARRQRLTLNHQGVLEVVVPAHALPSAWDVEAFLASHRAWIERAARRTRVEREAYENSRSAGLPTCLEFPLLSERWQVEYRLAPTRTLRIQDAGLRRIEGACEVHALVLSGPTDDEAFCRRGLARFTLMRAKKRIPPFAWEICQQIGAKPSGITVTSRKSAWGVCTSEGAIRLDRRLLFFPQTLARQVVLHEAAHLQHLNHSQQFYDELFSYEGSSKEAERALKKAIRHVPAWLIDA